MGTLPHNSNAWRLCLLVKKSRRTKFYPSEIVWLWCDVGLCWVFSFFYKALFGFLWIRDVKMCDHPGLFVLVCAQHMRQWYGTRPPYKLILSWKCAISKMNKYIHRIWQFCHTLDKNKWNRSVNCITPRSHWTFLDSDTISSYQADHKHFPDAGGLNSYLILW